MQIRRFRPGDEPALHHVHYTAIHQIARRDYSEEQRNAWAPPNPDREAWAAKIRGIAPWVAEREGELVGYADLQPSGYIDHFFVSGNHPRQGIGRALMEALHGEARRLGVAELTSHVSRTARGFFARFGFVVVEERVPVIRGVALPNAAMRKRLSPAMMVPADDGPCG